MNKPPIKDILNVDYIDSFCEKTPLFIRKNNNLIAHLIKAITEVSLSRYNKRADEDDTEVQMYSLSKHRKLELIFYGINSKKIIQNEINSKRGFFKICDYVYANKYFNDLQIGVETYATNLNNKLVIMNENDFKNKKIIKSKQDIHLTNFKFTNVENAYNIYYDIFEKNGKKYVFSIELIEIWYSKYNNTANTLINAYKTMDILLYMFNGSEELLYNMINELVGVKSYNNLVDTIDKNSALHGIYKIKVEELNTKYSKALNRIGNIDKNIQYKEDCIIDLHIKFSKFKKFDNKLRYLYFFSINSNHFNKRINRKINDLDLINLFKKTETKSKNKRKHITDIIFTEEDNYKSEDDEYNSSDSNDSIETNDEFSNKSIKKLSIRFTDIVINKDKITELLEDLIYGNMKFEYDYYKYGYINVYKDYDKYYTTHKYINFSFENLTKTKQSITYHAYLNYDLSRIIRASIKV